MERIDRVVRRFPKYSDRFQYEHALWMMWNIRRTEAKEILDRWSPSSHAALANMRKAGLLAELGAVDEAKSLLRFALRDIHRVIHTTPGQNIYLLSLEGWCMYLLHAIISGAERTSLYDRLSDRWHELKTWDCSPMAIDRPLRECNYGGGSTTKTRSRGTPCVRPMAENDKGSCGRFRDFPVVTGICMHQVVRAGRYTLELLRKGASQRMRVDKSVH